MAFAIITRGERVDHMFQIVSIEQNTNRHSTIDSGFCSEPEARSTAKDRIHRRFVDAAYDYSTYRILAVIMHDVARFCTSGERARAGDPTGWIGVRQLAVQRVWG